MIPFPNVRAGEYDVVAFLVEIGGSAAAVRHRMPAVLRFGVHPHAVGDVAPLEL